MEQVNLTAPTQVDPGASTFRVIQIYFNWVEDIIRIALLEWNGTKYKGHQIWAEYSGDTAHTLMLQLNTVNLSLKSLQRRIIERLQADGKLPAGSISGTPD